MVVPTRLAPATLRMGVGAAPGGSWLSLIAALLTVTEARGLVVESGDGVCGAARVLRAQHRIDELMVGAAQQLGGVVGRRIDPLLVDGALAPLAFLAGQPDGPLEAGGEDGARGPEVQAGDVRRRREPDPPKPQQVGGHVVAGELSQRARGPGPPP